MHLEHQETTEQIIGSAFEVYRVLGYGFLEKVYQRAMIAELSRRGLAAQEEAPLEVFYKGSCVGNYAADLFVEERVVVELKTCKTLCPEHEAQLLNELKAIEATVGLLINFGPEKVAFRRFVASNTSSAQNPRPSVATL